MIKSSTIFFIYDNINKENELYDGEGLIETGRSEAEIAELLNQIEFTPPDRILNRIFEKIF
ncbi:MAG: hypothetical protein ACOCZL_02430 [Bacteroidota bacterium]